MFVRLHSWSSFAPPPASLVSSFVAEQIHFFPVSLSGPPSLRLCNSTEEEKNIMNRRNHIDNLLICSSMLMCFGGGWEKKETRKRDGNERN
jgi:hypothetical protein